jgi:hypothetical protein
MDGAFWTVAEAEAIAEEEHGQNGFHRNDNSKQ